MAECCSSGKRLIYARSGGADGGEIADRVERRLLKKGFAKPSCPAGVGGHESGFIASAKSDVKNIVIGGCTEACARKTPEHIEAGITHFMLTDMRFNKGRRPATDDIVNDTTNRIITGSPVLQKAVSSPAENGCDCDRCRMSKVIINKGKDKL